MKITVICGGVGGAKFIRGLREHLRQTDPGAEITAIVNTGDDMWLTSLRIAPDLDSVMYTLAGQNDEVRGWGRLDESERVSTDMREYGVGWPWFTLGDLDLSTHITRSHYLRSGLPLSEATARITARWPLGVRLIPATDDEVETHVVLAEDGSEMHFQEWWTRHRAALPITGFVQRGLDGSTPAPGVLEAIAEADVVLFAPSNPVVSIGPVLGIPGIRDTVEGTSAPVIGVSPIIAGAVVRGMADACLTAIGVATAADAVALHYGARSRGGLIDGWLIDETDAASVPAIEAAGIRARAVPLWMKTVPLSAQLAADALALVG
ncbi:MAG: 2-phospho-L-lactate transferase [Microbacteriaceae bacterium]|nr:2-phospho-L-lactate transferase [Microbacteriaceae bacterium]